MKIKATVTRASLLLSATIVAFSSTVLADCNPWTRSFNNKELENFLEFYATTQAVKPPWHVSSEVVASKMSNNVSIHRSATTYSPPIKTSERVCTTRTETYIYIERGRRSTPVAKRNNWKLEQWQCNPSLNAAQPAMVYVIPYEKISPHFDCQSVDPDQYFQANHIVDSMVVQLVDALDVIREKANEYQEIGACQYTSHPQQCVTFDAMDDRITVIGTERIGEYNMFSYGPMNYFVELRRNSKKCVAPKKILFDMYDNKVSIAGVIQPML